MTRLLVSVEGETEEQFVNGILRPHLGGMGFHDVSARLVGKPRARRRRGGICSWGEAKNDLTRYLKGDSGLFVALMVDYYALPLDWPGREEANSLAHENKVNLVCQRLIADLTDELPDIASKKRFFPCILMHEFETLLFSDCNKFAEAVRIDVGAKMTEILQEFGDPERINDSYETKPSKRLEKLIPGYRKPLYGLIGARSIGLQSIRTNCSNFNNWLVAVEGLPALS